MLSQAGPPLHAGRRPPGLAQARWFTVLAHQQSNRCSLRPAELMSYLAGQRLQGSCCSPKSLSRCQRQAAALRRYSGIPQIPAGPYDIAAGLIQRLIRYQQAIRLTPAQRGVYRAAMQQG